MWGHYRMNQLKSQVDELVSQGQVSQEDADNFYKFISAKNQPSFNKYVYTRAGKMKHLENDA